MANETRSSEPARARRSIPRRERRLRATPALRRMVRETSLAADDFVYPLFVTHGRGVRKPIASMPGIFQLSVDQAVVEAELAASLGVPAVLLFGIPASKDPIGEENFSPTRRRRAGGARDQAGGAGAGRDHRRVPVRVHRPRPLRRAQRRRRGAAAPAPPRGLRPERRDARGARSCRGRARGSGRRPRRAERHDRRHGAEHPHGPRRTPTSRTSVSCRTR